MNINEWQVLKKIQYLQIVLPLTCNYSIKSEYPAQ